MSKPSTPPANPLWSFIKREPLVHFLSLAVLLFVANAVFSGDQRDVITVDAATRYFLVQQRQDLMLRDLTEQEKQEAVEDYIEEEILLREARKRGLENSSRIRQLLLQHMRFFITSDIPEPTDEVLKQFFEENPDQFATRPTFTYEHVFFSDPDAIPPITLELLRGGADYQQIGESAMNIAGPNTSDESQIVSTFGREQGREILKIDDDEWHGPFISSRGAHFIRLIEHNPSVVPTYEAIKGWLYQDWMSVKSQEVTEIEVAKMRKQYRVEIAPQENAGK